MTQLEKSEALILLKGAIQMAQQNNQVGEREMDLLESIMTTADIEPLEIGEFTDPITDDIDELADQLTSNVAKRTFLLALATVALADGNITEKEISLFKHLSDKLNVGTINLRTLTYEKAEATTLKFLKRDEESHLQDKQVSDFDLL